MSDPIVQGWCPGAHKPMMSGDGLVVRIRPVAAEITKKQAQGIAAAAEEFGNGFIDLTNRANLQIRGVADADYPALMDRMASLDLLDDDPSIEPKRNIVLTPFYRTNDVSHRLYRALCDRLTDFPEFPGKFGFAIDCGEQRVLKDVPADIRFERSASGALIVRADGCETGVEVSEDNATDIALDLAKWFMLKRPNSIRRMGKLLSTVDLPNRFKGAAPASTIDQSKPGEVAGGYAYAVPFGPMNAASLSELSNITDRIRITPWHSLWLESTEQSTNTDLITNPDDPILRVHACAGQPYCPQASVKTRDLARQLAGIWSGSLHVSGCAKGCAHPNSAEITFVGREGAFDLVTNGTAWDEPIKTALAPDDLKELDLT